MASRYAVFHEGAVIPVEDVFDWANWYEAADRQVARTPVTAEISVSTVFIGINVAFAGPPRWFETLVFGGPLDGEKAHYETLEQAMLGHEQMVGRVRAALAEARKQDSERDSH